MSRELNLKLRSDLLYSFDTTNMYQLDETVREEFNGDVKEYLNHLVDSYDMDVRDSATLRQTIVYLNATLRYFTVDCQHYVFERLFNNHKGIEI